MRAFQYHHIENFPVSPAIGEEWTSRVQLGFPEIESDDSAHSKIKYLGISTYKDYHKYHVRHETDKDCWIRIAREDRKRAIFIEEFNIFMPPNQSYIIIQSPTRSARDFLKRIKNNKPSFHYQLREINLLTLKEESQPDVKGGWFRNLDIENVQTAAIFGSTVSESAEWDNYETNGELSSLVIEFTYQGSKHSINISATGSITLFSNYDERFSLSLVEKFNKLVMKYATEYDPKQKKDLKKKE